MLSLSFLSLALLPYALAAPYDDPIHIPIVRRAIPAQERIARLPQVMDSIRLKYGFKPVNQKRATTSTPITDEVLLRPIYPASFLTSLCSKTTLVIQPSSASGHRMLLLISFVARLLNVRQIVLRIST